MKNITIEMDPSINSKSKLNNKQSYKPRKNSKMHPITKGKKKGDNYTFDECAVIAYMAMHPGELFNDKKNDVVEISKLFNRSESSIKLTTSNAISLLYKTSKLKNASNAMKLACETYKDIPKVEFKLVVANIINEYDPRK